MMFSAKRAIQIVGDVAFVGAASLEAVFIYRRTLGPDKLGYRWNLWTKLRSSDYDYDLYDNGFTVQHVHKQHFGISVAADERTLLVGAPYSDYRNRGDVAAREFYDTDGIDNRRLGTGNVFVFQSRPHVQSVALFSYAEIALGSFKLSYPTIVEWWLDFQVLSSLMLMKMNLK